MDIYRSEPGRALLRDWSSLQISRLLPDARCRWIDTPLGATHLTTVGSGPAVVLLPGTTFGAAASAYVVRALAADHRVTAVDVPGQPGLSHGERPADDLVGRYRAWIDEVLAAVGTEPATIVGESLGAAVALCAGPGPAVAGLVLVAPAGLVPARVTASLRPALPWLWHPTEARTERVLSFLSGGAPLPDRRHLVEWMTLVPEHARSSLAPAPLPNAVLTAWRDTPCVVLAGRRDPIFPAEELTRPARMLLGARVEFVADAGHLLAHSHPDAVRRGITAPGGPGAG